MKNVKLAGATVTGALVVWCAYLNLRATAIALGCALLLGIAYVYFIYFGRPSKVARTEEVRDKNWHTVDLGGATLSGDGSRYVIFVRKGESNNLLIQFSGGGACWDGFTASKPIAFRRMLLGYTRELRAYYFKSLSRLFPKALAGIADAGDAGNAFRDWNIVFIPYSTGDLHIGNTTNAYPHNGKTRTVHHNGRNNCSAALAWVFDNFTDVGKVLVSGESSGAWGAAFYAPTVADHYAGKQIYCLSDGVGLVSDRWGELADTVWKADTERTLGFKIGTDLFEDALLHRTDSTARNIKYLHSNTLYDDTLTRFGAALNHMSTDTTKFIDDWAAGTVASIKRLNESDLDYHYFLTDWGHNTKRHTTQHTLTTSAFYKKCTADGVSFSDWLRANVIEGTDLSLGDRLLG